MERLSWGRTGAGGAQMLSTLAAELECSELELGLVLGCEDLLLLFPPSDTGEDLIFLFLLKSSSSSTFICSQETKHTAVKPSTLPQLNSSLRVQLTCAKLF